MIDMTYGELVAALRKDLQLDATVDVLPGTVFAAALVDVGSHGTATAASKLAFIASLISPSRSTVRADLGITGGQANIVFSASTNSGPTTVTHTLGATPGLVVVSGGVNSAFGQIPNCAAINLTSTTFDIVAETKNVISGSLGAYWFAIG